jgi:hypothetical protein
LGIAGSVSVSGTANLLRSRQSASQGAGFVITGDSAALLWDHNLTAAAASFSVTGVASLLDRDLLVAQTGLFGVTGGPASFIYQQFLLGHTGVFVVNGDTAELFVVLPRLPEGVPQIFVTREPRDISTMAADQGFYSTRASFDVSVNEQDTARYAQAENNEQNVTQEEAVQVYTDQELKRIFSKASEAHTAVVRASNDLAVASHQETIFATAESDTIFVQD